MRIAFISHEFPPETGGGGIGTYLEQVSRMLAEAGHDVEVFAGTAGAPSEYQPCVGLRIRRVSCPKSMDFRHAVVPAFEAVQLNQPFDVIEGCDFDASALEIKKRFPALPYVVKLHTPRYVIDELQQVPLSIRSRMTMALGALRRFKLPHRESIRSSESAQAELQAVCLADEVASPSSAIRDRMIDDAGIEVERVSVFPYPYEAPEELLRIPIGTSHRRVTFIGRLEPRKGVIDIAKAIPDILQRIPELTFEFIGKPMIEAKSGLPMDEYLREMLGQDARSVEFSGMLPPADVRRRLGNTGICVFPSHWESFGLVCCEAMAAGRGVIGSRSGGMNEILGEGKYGLLVDPHSPEQIASAVIQLALDSSLRDRLGVSAREEILRTYNRKTVLTQQLESYERAVRHAHAVANDA